MITFGSVCSGIEAASTAWESLGFHAKWFSEIEAFPSAVLNHHWPHVANLGDMTKIAAAVRGGEVSAPDVLVGGTPCQAFSVAGARAGLSDPRGQLTISYVELADAIDQQRASEGKPAAVIVWENVPGVLSSKDNAFGAFLGLLSGEECELEPPGKKWANAGYVSGPKRAIAWRVLDAQYFGVAQRRRRVFVVASARTDFDPTKVLFERQGVRRDTPPSRESRSCVAALTANGVGTCGADDNQAQAGHLQPVIGTLAAHSFTGGAGGRPEGAAAGHFIPVAFGGGNRSGAIDVAACLTARGQRIDFEVETFIAQYSSTGQGAWAEGCGTLRAREQESHEHLAVLAFPERMSGTQYASTEDVSPSLMSRNPTAVAISFNSKDHGQDAAEEIAPTLRASGSINSNQNAGAPPAVVYDMAVRRLTPVECERLQGFPDNHTLIPVNKRNKLIADELEYLRTHFPDMPEEEAHRLAADGPRYKAIGNSMAVPVMHWIGKRIKQQLEGDV